MADIALYAIGCLLLLAVLLAASARRKTRIAHRKSRGSKGHKAARKPIAVLDGSNVMHWQDGTPRLDSVTGVVRRLEQLGYQAGVVFDANAGYLVSERYMDDAHFASHLKLHDDMVLVVPRGEQADPFLLRFASDNDAVLISNDRFRDRIAEFPKMAAPGRLVRGGYRNGKPWLDLHAVQTGKSRNRRNFPQ